MSNKRINGWVFVRFSAVLVVFFFHVMLVRLCVGLNNIFPEIFNQ